VVLYNVSVTGVRVVEFGPYGLEKLSRSDCPSAFCQALLSGGFLSGQNYGVNVQMYVQRPDDRQVHEKLPIHPSTYHIVYSRV